MSAVYLSGAAAIETWRNDQLGDVSNVEGYFGELRGRIELGIVCLAAIQGKTVADLRMVFSDMEPLQPWTDEINRFGTPENPSTWTIKPTSAFTAFCNAIKLTRAGSVPTEKTDFDSYARAAYMEIVERFNVAFAGACRAVVPNAQVGYYAAPPQWFWEWVRFGNDSQALYDSREPIRREWINSALLKQAASVVRHYTCIMPSFYGPYFVIPTFQNLPWTLHAAAHNIWLSKALSVARELAQAVNLPMICWISGGSGSDLDNPYVALVQSPLFYDTVLAATAAAPETIALAFYADTASPPHGTLGTPLNEWYRGPVSGFLTSLNFA